MVKNKWVNYVPPTRRTYCFWLVRIPSAFVLLLVCTLSTEPVGRLWPNLHIQIIGTLGQGKEVIRFWWPWPYFQGQTSTLKFSIFDRKKLVCTLSLEPNDRFWPNFMYCSENTLGSFISPLHHFEWQKCTWTAKSKHISQQTIYINTHQQGTEFSCASPHLTD